MDEVTAVFLTSDAGRDLLKRVADMPGDTPARVLSLRKRNLAPEVAAAVVEVVEARKRARRRFADAESLFFTDESLAQATSPGIAAYHASRLASFGTVADLCCGIGIDAVAIAEAGASEVLAIDLDPARLAFARANAAVRGVSDRITFVVGDVTTMDWAGRVRAAFFDPARRTDVARVSRHGDRYAPPLSFFAEIAARTEAACAKLSPALPDEELVALGAVELLSENRECKEACVWTGDAVADMGEEEAASLTAMLLPEGVALPGSAEDPAPFAPVAATPGAYLLDPDPAAIRAHALPSLCERAGANTALLTYDDTYLTADAPPTEPRLASAYRITDVLPYHPKTVGGLLRGRGVGRLVVKKRYFSKEPDAVARELGLKGRGEEATLVLVRDFRGFLAVICEPVSATASAASAA